MSVFTRSGVCILFLGWMFLSASAHDVDVEGLVVVHPVIAATSKSVAAGYMEIANNSDTPDRLLSVSADFSGKSEIHQTESVNGAIQTRLIREGLVLNPRETISLENGGIHLVFMKLTEPMEVGQLRRATLLFESAGPIEIALRVIGPSELEEYKAQHHEHKH